MNFDLDLVILISCDGWEEFHCVSLLSETISNCIRDYPWIVFSGSGFLSAGMRGSVDCDLL